VASNDEQIRVALDRLDLTLTAEYKAHVTKKFIDEFASLFEDRHPIHDNDAYAADTPFGRPIAHGALLMGFMSSASTYLTQKAQEQIGYDNVSLGYDRVRFITPVFADDTITTKIAITEVNREKLRAICDVKCINQHGAVVASAAHIMRFI